MNTEAGRANRNQTPAGIGYMLVGVMFMMGMDMSAKWLLETYSLPQLVFLRCLFSVLTIGFFLLGQRGFHALRTDRPWWHVLRSLMMAGATFAFFHALRHIPLAEIVTIAFAAPLIVTSLSGPLLGEKVGPWRWSAVLAGFVGVIIVVRPGDALIGSGVLGAVLGTVLWAGLSLTARKLSRTESTSALSIYLFPVPLLIGAAGSLNAWVSPGWSAWFLFALCGMLGGLSFIAINAAFRRAPAAVIVPFEYSGLIWAAAAGFVIWGERPDLQTWFGATVIICSGLCILYRETRGRPEEGVESDFPVQEAVALGKDE